MVRSTDRPAMTIAVDLGRKSTKQTNKHIFVPYGLFMSGYLDENSTFKMISTYLFKFIFLSIKYPWLA